MPIPRACFLKKVKTWQETPLVTELTALEQCFYNALNAGAASGFFEHIFVPVKIPTADGMPESWTYKNIGFDYKTAAACYSDFYGENSLIEPLEKRDIEINDYMISCQKLGHRIRSVLDANMYRYLKLIELGGFKYEPLWNVDGEEIYTSLEAEGHTKETVTQAVDRIDYHDTSSTVETSKNLYDGSERTDNTVTTTEDPQVTNGVPQHNYTRSRADPHDNVTERTIEHENADNGDEDFTVSAEDTAFNQAVAGGDKYHTDKRIRRGNIGVISTMELIEKQRRVVESSIMLAFFEDINEQILVGIYDL